MSSTIFERTRLAQAPPQAAARGGDGRLAAGGALLLSALLAGFGELLVVDRLTVADDAAQTAAHIAASATLFRLGVASLLVVAALDVVVGWALFRVFEPVDRALSLLAAAFRVVYAGVFAVAIAQLAAVLRLLPDAQGSAAQVLSDVRAYRDVWSAGLVLFGLHLLLVGLLLRRAAWAPTWLGVLVALSGLGYAVDGLGAVLVRGYGADVAAYTFVGELVLTFWLLLGARRPRGTGGGR